MSEVDWQMAPDAALAMPRVSNRNRLTEIEARPDGQALADAMAAPFIAGWEVLRMPVAAILDWPGSVTTQDPAYFDRYHQPASTFDLGTTGSNQ